MHARDIASKTIKNEIGIDDIYQVTFEKILKRIFIVGKMKTKEYMIRKILLSKMISRIHAFYL